MEILYRRQRICVCKVIFVIGKLLAEGYKILEEKSAGKMIKGITDELCKIMGLTENADQ